VNISDYVIYDLNKSNKIASNIKLKIFNAM